MITARSRLIPGLLGVSVVISAVSCGGEPTSMDVEVVPVAFEVQSGNDQLFFPNAPVPDRLSVRLVDADGAPVMKGGVPVVWEVLEGDGTVMPVEDTTSSLGSAAADYTFGSEVGISRISVAATDIAAAEFVARSTLPGPIVFVSNRRTGILGNDVEGYPGDLFVMNEDGSDVVGLFPPNSVTQSLFDPTWSPDGETILYVRAMGRIVGGTPGLMPIGMFIINADGSDDRQVPASAFPPYVRYYADPAWSPVGTMIIANLAAEGVLNIPAEVTPGALHIMSRTGVAPQPLDAVSGTARAPSWDANSGRIAFECESGSSTAICTMDQHGNGLEFLTDGFAGGDTDPAWSPDGSQLLFARDTLSGGGIWRVNTDGTELELLVEGRAKSPSWSPDGTRFVYEQNVDGMIDVWLFDFASSSTINLTNAGSRDSEPAWRW